MSPHEETEESDASMVEAMKARLALMSSEAEVLRQMNLDNAAKEEVDNAARLTVVTESAQEEKEAVDSRSVYVGNVDYASTPEELQIHFAVAGVVNRITILYDKFTGPKGYAYVEFAETVHVAEAVLLDGSSFRGRQITVVPKRTNVPGMGARGGRGGRGRGRGRGAPRGAYRGGYQGGYQGYNPYGAPPPRGRGGFRGRGGY